MSEQLDWKICPACGCPMLPIDAAPVAEWGCEGCGGAWSASRALEPNAGDWLLLNAQMLRDEVFL
jgi:hypothetical protein